VPLLAEDPRGAGKADIKGHGACARVTSGPVVEHKVQVTPVGRGDVQLRELEPVRRLDPQRLGSWSMNVVTI